MFQSRSYSVFIKYCVFFQEFSKVYHLSLASTRLLLVVQKLPANWSGCTLALRWELWGLLHWLRRGRGCSELWKSTIFPEYPVVIWVPLNETNLRNPWGKFVNSPFKTGTVDVYHHYLDLVHWKTDVMRQQKCWDELLPRFLQTTRLSTGVLCV